MLVLIATTELQGTSPGDYSHTVEGELVTPLVGVQCASPDRCGCGRGFPGLASSKATTTAMIVDRPYLTDADLRDAVCDWLDRGGWTDMFREAGEPEELIEEIVDEHVEVIGEICTAYPVGSVVERDGDLVSSRSYRLAA